MNEKKTAAINARVTPSLRKRITTLEERHGVGAATQIEDALMALCDAVDREGRYVRPMRMILGGETLPLAGESSQAHYEAGHKITEHAVALLKKKTDSDASGQASLSAHK